MKRYRALVAGPLVTVADYRYRTRRGAILQDIEFIGPPEHIDMHGQATIQPRQ
jgi:hypothetical protein